MENWKASCVGWAGDNHDGEGDDDVIKSINKLQMTMLMIT